MTTPEKDCQHMQLRCRKCLRDVEDGLYEQLITVIQEKTRLELKILQMQSDRAVKEILSPGVQQELF